MIAGRRPTVRAATASDGGMVVKQLGWFSSAGEFLGVAVDRPRLTETNSTGPGLIWRACR